VYLAGGPADGFAAALREYRAVVPAPAPGEPPSLAREGTRLADVQAAAQAQLDTIVADHPRGGLAFDPDARAAVDERRTATRALADYWAQSRLGRARTEKQSWTHAAQQAQEQLLADLPPRLRAFAETDGLDAMVTDQSLRVPDAVRRAVTGIQQTRRAAVAAAVIDPRDARVVPVLLLPMDVPSAGPADTTAEAGRLEQAVSQVQTWYAAQLGGATFDLHPVEIVRSPRPSGFGLRPPEEGGPDMLQIAWRDTAALRERLRADDPDEEVHNIFVVFTKTAEPWPVATMDWGADSEIVVGDWAIANLLHRYTPRPDGGLPTGRQRALGVLAHEIGHGLLLPHPDEYGSSPPDANVMDSEFVPYPASGLTGFERRLLGGITGPGAGTLADAALDDDVTEHPIPPTLEDQAWIDGVDAEEADGPRKLPTVVEAPAGMRVVVPGGPPVAAGTSAVAVLKDHSLSILELEPSGGPIAGDPDRY
jgi:hypothetical protein